MNAENEHKNAVQNWFKIEKAKVEDLDAALEFMLDNFMLNEPLCAAVDLKRDEAYHFFRDVIQICLQKQDGLSYLVRLTENDGGKEKAIIGALMACILRRPTTSTNEGGGGGGGGGGAFGDEKRMEGENWKVREIDGILHTVESKIWELVPPNVDCLLNLLMLSVSEEYGGRGIAGALCEHNLEEARQRGCQGTIAEATSWKSQKLFQKKGYWRLYELPFSQWTDPNGMAVFNAKDGTDRTTLEFKPF